MRYAEGLSQCSGSFFVGEQLERLEIVVRRSDGRFEAIAMTADELVSGEAGGQKDSDLLPLDDSEEVSKSLG
jgi:hypothetical protein